MVNLSVVEQLLNHINRFALCKTTDKILLAVSGGLDSMVMLHLMKAAGFRAGVAHCNFQLRGDDSIADQDHVREASAELNIPFFSTRFEPKRYAAEQGISVQMAARDLRYAWFRKMLGEQGYDYLATAHHLNDSIETVFLNLVRGTGISGLSGIPPRNGSVIRPLLFASRKMLLDYALEHSVRWREDSSNRADDYHRNFFRHQIIPRFEELNPNFEETFRDTQERLSGTLDIQQALLEEFRLLAVVQKGDDISIHIEKLKRSPAPAVILWELIKGLGFNFDQCRRIVEAHQPGKLFYSPSHQLLVDREYYFVGKKRGHVFTPVSIQPGERVAGNAMRTLIFKEVAVQNFELIRESNLAQVDQDLLQFPLTWRSWQAGDYFVPLGMGQEKKLSDFLIDLKIPFNEKADITVLESGGQILWVVGFRISERFKVMPDTKRILVIEQKTFEG